MTRDIVRDNIDNYLGDRARKDWTADLDLYQVEEQIIRRHFPAPPASILDVGCGGGRTTLGLENRGFDVEALDLSADLVDEARKRLKRSPVHVMDARQLEFPDDKFDAALFSFNGLDCLYPSVERLRVLREVHRVLRPGAVFYYSGHNALGAWTPRPGDTIGKVLARNRRLLLAQRTPFKERMRYLAYPEASGTQILYSAPPHVHVVEQREVGFLPLAVYGSRSYRKGPHFLDEIDVGRPSLARLAQLSRISLLCPHLHYVARKPFARM